MYKRLFWILCALMLSAGFYQNAWGTAERTWFQTFQSDSEALVIGGLAKNQQHGVKASEYKLGNTVPPEAYLQDAPIQEWRPYTSQIGLQGWAFSLIDELLPIDNRVFVELMRVLNSLALAALLVALACWVEAELGLFAALSGLVFFVLSPWVTVFARNLYWVEWTWYLPMVLAVWLARRERQNRPMARRVAFGSLAGAVFVKSACGYEYISAVLVAMLIPFLYYALADRWPLRRTLSTLMGAGLSGLGGFGTAVLLHIGLRALDLGSFGAGFKAFVEIVMYRTSIDSSKFSAPLRESLQATHAQVLRTYLDSMVISWGGAFQMTSAVLIGSLFALSLLLGGLALLRVRLDRKLLAWHACAYFALLGPLAWYYVAKGHSYIHIHMNHVLWSVPFGFLWLVSYASLVPLAVNAIGAWRERRQPLAVS